MGNKELMTTKFETTADEIIDVAQAIVEDHDDMPAMAGIQMILVASMIGRRLVDIKLKNSIDDLIKDVEDNQ